MRKGKAVGDEIFIAAKNKKNATVIDGRLTDIFSDVGRRYGYDDVRAEFSGVKDYKVRWQCLSRRIGIPGLSEV